MVLLELYGDYKGELWWVGTSSMAVCEVLQGDLRKCKLNYRTQRAKRSKTTNFTTYFPPLPTIFGTYRPVSVDSQVRLLEAWQDATESNYPGKYIAISPVQVLTLQHCVDRFGVAHRTIERPVVWKGNLRPGFMVTTDW